MTLLVDFATMLVAQHRLEQVAQSTLPGADVQAKVGGWPVSVHLLADELGSATIDVTNVTVSTHGRDLHVMTLHASAHGIHGVRSSAPTTLDSVSGTVYLSWKELSAQTGASLSAGDDGLVRVTGIVPVFGESLPGSLSGELELDVESQQLRITNPTGSIDGITVPTDVLAGLISRLSSRFSLPTVSGLHWTDIHTDHDGVVLRFAGAGLIITR
ncbi:MAG: LmeA family phospholipid-binding protein [Propionibacteriaceae bacterium]